MNLSSLPRCGTIALVKSGGFLMSARVLRLWPPKCHGPIVEVGSHIIIIVIIVIIVIVISGAPRAREARAARSTMGKKIW